MGAHHSRRSAPLSAEDFRRTVPIRGEPHSILRAINRQVAHYAYHVRAARLPGEALLAGTPLGDAEHHGVRKVGPVQEELQVQGLTFRRKLTVFRQEPVITPFIGVPKLPLVS